jgi:NAD(P)-dependent dehydrogenase (short-subunit alcohol dehydrogenase family)
MNRLADRTAVITGGSSGIGLATAQRFVDEGVYVFIVGKRQAELDKAVQADWPQCVGRASGRDQARRSRSPVFRCQAGTRQHRRSFRQFRFDRAPDAR